MRRGSVVDGAGVTSEWSIVGEVLRHDPRTCQVSVKDSMTGEIQTLDFNSKWGDYVRSEIFKFARNLHSKGKNGTLEEEVRKAQANERGPNKKTIRRNISLANDLICALETGGAQDDDDGDDEKVDGDSLSPLEQQDGDDEEDKKAEAKKRWKKVKSSVTATTVMNVFKQSTSKRAMDWGVIHPLEPWRLAFDYFLMALIVYSIIVVPYRLAFDVPAEAGWLAFELTVDGLFLMDMMLNFNTAIFVGEELIGKRKTITAKYLRGWFVVDFLSTIPFDFIVDAILGPQASSGNKDLKWFRLARLLKLVRLAKLFKVFSKFEQEGRLNPATVQLIQLSIAVGFLGHILACIWFMVGVATLDAQLARGIEPSQTRSWISSSLNITVMPPAQQYAASLYWSFTTMTTLGYGDIVPQNNSERIFAMFAMLFGAIVFGYVIGNISALAGASHAYDLQKTTVQRDVKEFCKAHRLDPQLTWKVRRLINHQLEMQGVLFEEQVILDALPVKLKNQVYSSIVRDNLAKFKFFWDKSSEFTAELVSKMRPDLFVANDMVYTKGDDSDSIIFLLNGQMAVNNELGSHAVEAIHILSEGSVVGDVGVLLDIPRTSTITAVSLCEALSITRQEMFDILRNHPTIHEKMHTQAMALLEIIRAREDADDGRIKSPVRNNESQVLPEEGGLGGLGLPGGGDGVAAVPDALERNLSQRTANEASTHVDPFTTSVEEKDRDSKSCVGLFDPSLGFRLRWDMALAIIIIYSCLVGPYRMAFKVPALEGWFVFELLCDALFLVDICLNFNTAYFNQDDILVTNRRQIALNYLSFWFWLDLLSTVPIDLIMDSIGLEAGDSSGAQFKLLKLTRLVRLIKLTRLAKLQAFFKKLEEDDIVDLNTMRLVKLLMSIIFISHLLGCMYAFLGYFDDPNWLQAYGISTDPPVVQWLASVYWAITLLTTVGYGDVLPVNTAERLMNIICMLVGALVFGTIVGDITTVADDLGKDKAKRRLEMTMLNSYMGFRKLEKSLQYKIRKTYFDNYDNSKLSVNDQSTQRVMSMLSATLRRDVMKQMVKEIESQIAFLKTRDPDFISEISKCLVRNTFTDGEYLFKEEEPMPHQICFLTEGAVNVFKASCPTDIQRFEAVSDRIDMLGDECKQRPWLMEDMFATEGGFVNLPSPPANVQADGHVEVYLLFRVRFNTLLCTDGLQADGVQFLRDLSEHGGCSHMHLKGRTRMWREVFDGEGAFEIFPEEVNQPRKLSGGSSQLSRLGSLRHQRTPSIRVRSSSNTSLSTPELINTPDK